jgi:hypothetical protein
MSGQQAASPLATSKKKQETDAAIKRFWSLYWGELALVEDKRVESAMVQFGRALESDRTDTEIQQASPLQEASVTHEILLFSILLKSLSAPRPDALGTFPAQLICLFTL